jgi:thioredoxin 1
MAKASFNDIVKGEKPTLVDFYADWCGPCKMMAPILEEIKSELKEEVRIVKIDVDKNPGIAQKFQVQGVPTLMVFKNGEIKWRQSGVVPTEYLRKAIQEAG